MVQFRLAHKVLRSLLFRAEGLADASEQCSAASLTFPLPFLKRCHEALVELEAQHQAQRKRVEHPPLYTQCPNGRQLFTPTKQWVCEPTCPRCQGAGIERFLL